MASILMLPRKLFPLTVQLAPKRSQVDFQVFSGQYCYSDRVLNNFPADGAQLRVSFFKY